MKFFIGTVCLALALAASAEEISSAEVPDVFNYHRRFGIPRANELMKLEAEETTDISRIVGGSVVDISQVPYQVGLVITIWWIFTSVCGGSLVSPTRVITAAHCQNDGVNSATSMTTVHGSNTLFSGGTRVVASSVVMHPNWTPSTAANDIAVITINAINLSNVIQPIALPSSLVGNPLVGSIARASGYGLTSDGGNIPVTQRVSAVDLPVISNADCAAVYGPWVHSTNICTSGAGGRGTCSGDSGGPLALSVNGAPTLIGVTSYGAAAGCAAGFPAAFARVTDFLPWIASI